MSKQQETNFQFKARYFKSGEINAHTKSIWFVLHGYGQLAEYFLRKFSVLENEETCIIAPEGLSRFYLSENTGRVGATWMTKENRLMDIENYLQYLDSIFETEIPNDHSAKVTVLGFSQGAATASRWVIRRGSGIGRLILWAGIFPPDLNFEKGSTILKNIEVVEVYGQSDPYLTDEKYKEMTLLNSKLDLSAQIIRFEGGHEIHAPTLQQLI